MKKYMKKILISVVLIFTLGFVASAYTPITNTASAATVATSGGVTKVVKDGWGAGGYKLTIYLNHKDTQTLVNDYKKISAFLAGLTGMVAWIAKIITAPLSYAFKNEAPYIKAADKGNGIYIPITITWILVPYVKGYYPQ